MPTYAYLCSACGHTLDAVQRMSEDALTDCPNCHTPELVRQISAVGFALKGSGWYVTDFRDKGKAAPKPDSTPGTPSEPAAATTATATAPAETKSSSPGDAAA